MSILAKKKLLSNYQIQKYWKHDVNNNKISLLNTALSNHVIIQFIIVYRRQKFSVMYKEKLKPCFDR